MNDVPITHPNWGGPRPSSARRLAEARPLFEQLPPDSPFGKGHVLRDDNDRDLLRLWPHFRLICAEGSMIWASAEFGAMLDFATDSVPMDTTLAEDMVGFPCALLVHEEPLLDRSGADAIMWKVTTAGVLAGLGNWGTLPLPSGLCTWHWGESIADAIERYARESAHTPSLQSADRRGEILAPSLQMFAAVSLLLTQRGVTEQHDQNPDRASQRRATRSGRTLPPVRVVRVRGEGATSGHSGRHLTRRFVVRGHWRQQTYGPLGSLRRPTWIAPHIKGPADAPLDARPTVYVFGGTKETG